MSNFRGLPAPALLAVLGILTGCLETGTEAIVGKQAEGGKKEKRGSPAAVSARLAGLSYYFAKHEEVQSDGGTGVEKFVDCGVNEVLVGWGGRVDGDGNFTDIKIGCKHVFPDGLGGYTAIVPNGSTPAEKYVEADPGYVVVGVGGVVDNENLTRAVIRQCPWNVGTMNVSPGLCTYKSSDASNATELFMDVHNLVDPAKRPWTVLTGVGATAGFQALKAVRATKGTLKIVPINLKNLSGGEHRFSFEVPAGGLNVRIFTYGQIQAGTGDADLYVGKDFAPNAGNYTCRSVTATNDESCYFQQAGTYHILLHPYSPYTNVTLRAEYTKD